MFPSLEGGVVVVRQFAKAGGQSCLCSFVSQENEAHPEEVDIPGEPGATLPLQPLAGGLCVDRHTETYAKQSTLS